VGEVSPTALQENHFPFVIGHFSSAILGECHNEPDLLAVLVARRASAHVMNKGKMANEKCPMINGK